MSNFLFFYKSKYGINDVLSGLVYARILEPCSKRSSFKATSEFLEKPFLLFPRNANEQASLKPLEKKVLKNFGCQKYVYCSDAGLGSKSIREYNHTGRWLIP